MSHNGQDKSGNVFKYSLIPLMLGIAVIFFIHRSSDSEVFEAKPLKGTTTVFVEDEQLEPEQPWATQETSSVTADTTTVEVTEAVANDTLQ